MPRLSVTLSESHFKTLVRLSATERRHPSDQAAFLLEREIARGYADDAARWRQWSGGARCPLTPHRSLRPTRSCGPPAGDRAEHM